MHALPGPLPTIALAGLLLSLALASPAAGQEAGHGGAADTVPPPPDRERGIPTPSLAGPKPLAAAPTSPMGPPRAEPSPEPFAFAPGAAPETTDWQWWWLYNRAPLLDLKRAAQGDDAGVLAQDDGFDAFRHDLAHWLRRPSREVLAADVVPALVRACEARDARVRAASLLALAKIGDDASGLPTSLVERFEEALDDPTREVAEAAALALGVLGEEAALPTLVALLSDDARGRALVGSTEVSPRVRAYAGYGLGSVGAATPHVDLRRVAVAHLFDALQDERAATTDVSVAAVVALGVVPLPWEPAPGAASDLPSASGRAQCEHLLALLSPRARRRPDVVRAQVPTALARLAASAPEDGRLRITQELVDALAPRRNTPRAVQQSCALALGRLADCDRGGLDAEVRARLARLTLSGEEQTRRFALIALGRIAGRMGTGAEPWAGAEECEAALLRALARGSNALTPWAALALGVAAQAQRAAGLVPSVPAARALRALVEDCRRPQEAGALALALALAGDDAAQALLRARLDAFADDGARGHVAVALGLLGDPASTPALRHLLRAAVGRPALLEETAVALALLGDLDLAPELLTLLDEAGSTAERVALLRALGRVGDARALHALVTTLEDEEDSGSTRAAAATALGDVCDRHAHGWSSLYSIDANYRAATPTLAGEAGAVLRID